VLARVPDAGTTVGLVLLVAGALGFALARPALALGGAVAVAVVVLLILDRRAHPEVEPAAVLT